MVQSQIQPRHEVIGSLVAVATGRRPADLVIRNCRLVNVHSREILSAQDIAIANGRFAYCGPDASHCIGELTIIVEAGGLMALPGLCDGHMHIESGMLTPARFAEAVMPHGTTTMFVDPHEIANVLGLKGVEAMNAEAVMQPINIFMQVPSCVPSAPGLETPGAEITPMDVAEAMQWENIVGLGEMMNFPGVIGGDEKMLAEMAITMAAGKVVGGHYASPDLGMPFHAYAAGGAADDHEGTRERDAVARVRQGMRAMLRLGSAWYDVERQVTAITERGLDPRNFILCTDDCNAQTLVEDGHMDRVVRHAISCGCDPLVAVQMATINTATHFGMEREIGSIAPGRRADVLLVDNLEELSILQVFARGRLVAREGKLLATLPRADWPRESRQSVNTGRELTDDDFSICAPPGGGNGAALARVIGIIENQAPTKELLVELPVSGSLVNASATEDVCQAALVERHRGAGRVVNGFVQGFGYNGDMAMASTVAHDCHHMIVVGTCRQNMALAANRLAEVQGGASLWREGEEAALVELPIAGLMSDRKAKHVAAASRKLSEAMAQCGCHLNNAFMQHSLLALAVIPELRITDLGLVDVRKFELVDLFCNG
ncbi:MAG: adenine deaminase [Rhodobacteraceae bacterium]|nr:adenine deaminase [Paracoccaceae bacterium]